MVNNSVNPYCRGTLYVDAQSGKCTTVAVGSKSVEYVPAPICRKTVYSSCVTPAQNRISLMPRLNNQRGVSSSLRQSSLSAMIVTGKNGENNPLRKYGGLNWNQSSDRAVPHGKGVDIKHNSYFRAYARIKGRVLRESGYDETTPTIVGSNCKSGGSQSVCLPLCPASEESS